jgi:peptidoglycan/LPS O-acetylase OafA/YrhL
MEWLKNRFELSRGGDAHNMRSMEGLRGFAVFLVFLVHYVSLVNPWIDSNRDVLVFSSALYVIGNAGVDLFFVLSGYLIYGSLIARPQPFARFIGRRIQRIYPAFIAVFCIYIVLSYVFPHESKIPAPAVKGIIYLAQNLLLLPGLFPIEPMILVAWSLSYEMFYYLAIPAIIGLFRLRDRSVTWRVVFFSTVALLTTVYCAAYGGPVRLIMFIAGILLYEAMRNREGFFPHSLVGLVAGIVGLLSLLLPIAGNAGETLKVVILFISFFTLCLVCFHHPGEWLARIFLWTPLRWLGNMSYSYYLLHGLSLKAAFMVLAKILPPADQGAWLFGALLPVMFVFTLFPTAALFLLVERPFSLAPRSGRPAVAVPREVANRGI